MLKPLLDRVLLKKEETETVTKSGIVIADKSKEKPNVGKVIAVGPGKEDVKMQVSVGDRVIFKPYSTTEVEDGFEKYSLVEMKDILAIIEEE